MASKIVEFINSQKQLQLSTSAIFESGHMRFSSGPKWSAKAAGKLCSTTAVASSISAGGHHFHKMK